MNSIGGTPEGSPGGGPKDILIRKKFFRIFIVGSCMKKSGERFSSRMLRLVLQRRAQGFLVCIDDRIYE